MSLLYNIIMQHTHTHTTLMAGPGGYCEDSTRYFGQYPREGPQESFYWW